MKAVLIALGCGMALLGILIAIGAREASAPVTERIKRECQKLHPYSEEQANQCRIELSLRYLNDTEAANMNRAYQRIR